MEWGLSSAGRGDPMAEPQKGPPPPPGRGRRRLGRGYHLSKVHADVGLGAQSGELWLAGRLGAGRKADRGGVPLPVRNQRLDHPPGRGRELCCRRPSDVTQRPVSEGVRRCGSRRNPSQPTMRRERRVSALAGLARRGRGDRAGRALTQQGARVRRRSWEQGGAERRPLARRARTSELPLAKEHHARSIVHEDRQKRSAREGTRHDSGGRGVLWRVPEVESGDER